jgi:hypothetical protein
MGAKKGRKISELLVFAIAVVEIDFMGIGCGAPDTDPELFKGQSTEFCVFGLGHMFKERMKIVPLRNRVLAPDKFNKGQGISATNEQILHLLPAWNELLGRRGQCLLEGGTGGRICESHGDDPVTCNGEFTVSKKVSLSATIGTDHWF